MMKFRIGVLFIALIIIIGSFVRSVFAYEEVVQNGDELLLELAPVDPRSLMQGDYMRLAYAIERDYPKGEKETSGYLIVKRNSDGVGEALRFDGGEVLQDDEYRVHYKSKGGRLIIAPNSFLFQEGHAEHYEVARYGIFSFGKDGLHILTGLADENRDRINVRSAPDDQ